MPDCGSITATVIAKAYDIIHFSSTDKFISYTGLAPINKRYIVCL